MTFPSRSRRRSILAACFVAAVALLAANAGAGADGSRPREGEEPDAPPCTEAKVEFCEGYVDELTQAERLLNDGGVGHQIRAMLGDRFGGSWVDSTDYYPDGFPQAERRFRFAVVGGPTPEDEARLRQLTSSHPRIVLIAAAHSRRQLEEWDRRATEIVFPHQGPGRLYCTYAGKRRVVVQATAPVDPAVLAQLQAAIPPDVLRVYVHPDVCVTRLAHTTRVDYPPYEAGLGLTMVPPAP